MSVVNDLNTLISRLDRSGFKISMSERINAHRILTITDTLNELKLGLRMIFAKNRQQQELFELLWDMGIIAPEPMNTEEITEMNTVEPIDAGLNLPKQGTSEFCINGITPGGSGGQSQGMGSGVPGVDSFTALIQFSSSFKGATRQLLQGNIRNGAANMLRQITQNSYSVDELQRRKRKAMKEMQEMLDIIAPNHADLLMHELEREFLSLIKERLDILENIRVKDPFSANEIDDLPLMSLTKSPELSLALKRMGKKLASKHKRRKKSGNSKINLRQTIRANIQHGGTILELRKQNPRKEKPRLIVMTDISSSTLHATQLFMSIIWNAKEIFRDIRFYDFIGSCIDVTNEFRSAKSVDEAMKKSLQSWTENTLGRENSDYYRAMLTFERMVANRVSAKTTVIILGDLRDWLGPWKENKPASAAIFGRIGKKVKRIIVLNPEPRNMWDTGDSICKYCTDEGVEVYETTTLKMLIDVLLKIM